MRASSFKSSRAVRRTSASRPLITCFHAFAIVALVCAGLSVSCGAPKQAPEATRTFTDEIGRTLNVTPTPKRIVSLAPSITETLFALGLDDRIVGVTSFCDYPPEAKTKQSVGDTQTPSLEKIVALKPDLVIISTASQLEQSLRHLDELRIPVYVSNPRDIEGLLHSIERLGEIVGVPDRASEVTRQMRSRIDAVLARVAERHPPRVLFILGCEPLITVGAPSFVSDLIDRAGGRSISAGEPADYPQYSLETAVAKQPEVIFLQAGNEELPARLRQTPAVHEGRVYKLDDNLLLRPGPRIVDGLEEMAIRIHPR